MEGYSIRYYSNYHILDYELRFRTCVFLRLACGEQQGASPDVQQLQLQSSASDTER